MVFSNPHDTSLTVFRAGITKAELPWWQISVRGFLAGAFIALGGLFSIIVAGGLTSIKVSDPGLQKLIGAFVFPFGLVLVAQTGAELFTSNIMFLAPGILARKISFKNLFINWGLAWFTNFLGSLFVAFFLSWLAGLTTGEPVNSYIKGIATAKSNYNWGESFLRGIGCNWLVCLSMFCAAAADDVMGRVIGIWPPITAFVAIGFEHSVANMFYVPLGIFQGAANTNFGIFLYNNLLPVTLGNMVGGFLFVGCVFYWVYLKDDTLHVATVKAISRTSHVRPSVKPKDVVLPTIAGDIPIMPIPADTADHPEVVVEDEART